MQKMHNLTSLHSTKIRKMDDRASNYYRIISDFQTSHRFYRWAAGVPEVGRWFSADGDSFVLLIISFKDLLNFRRLQQSHTGGKLSVTVIWITATQQGSNQHRSREWQQQNQQKNI